MNKDGQTLHFEDEFDFKLILHERDFVPGVTNHANIVDAIRQAEGWSWFYPGKYIEHRQITYFNLQLLFGFK